MSQLKQVSGIKQKLNLNIFCGKFNVWYTLIVCTFFLGFYDNPDRRYELKQDKKKKLYKFLPFYIQLKDFFKNNVSAFVLVKIRQICSKQSLILKMFIFKYTLKTRQNA
jgi:hypothetical protein